ncbi:hypothetical protein [Thermomonospora catenispora]|uniref:hypothetical protein n=1 Tax=Thermomonospora catenispora TaxID=2493090 RepID=UPI0011232D30|nr:hypothetical protein [Thermomonospora catenispora]TNY37081.1 hypothetical protein EIO00_09540 [Thermomonospora catenispora]
MTVTGEGEAIHRTLDGTVITLAGDLDLSAPYSSVVRLGFMRRLHELTAVDRAFVADWAQGLGVDRLTEEYRMQGGRLRIGTTVVRDESLADFPEHQRRAGTERVLAAAWEGRRHAVCAHFYHARPADAIRLFAALQITEHPDGAALTPRTRHGAVIAETASLVKDVPGIGLLEISPLNRETARRLPAHRGTRLRTGELYRDTHEDGGIYFVMTTPTAVVTVLPDAEEAPQAPTLLDRLTVSAALKETP